MLAIHQDIQEKLFNELQMAYDQQESESDNDIIGKLNYMEMVIKETMRLFPVGPFLGRECKADTKLRKFFFLITELCADKNT